MNLCYPDNHTAFTANSRSIHIYLDTGIRFNFFAKYQSVVVKREVNKN